MSITQATVRNDQLELQRRGFINVSLTALSTTAVPDVEVGSAWEIGGSIYEVDTGDETPSGWSGISNDTQVYIKFTASGEALEFTTTAPSYSAAKGGWYSGNDRYLARVYKDSSGNAAGKAVYPQWPETYAYIPGGLSGGNIPFSNIETLTSGSSWTVPDDVYRVKATIVGAGGGGGASLGAGGSAGGDTTFNSVTSSGGLGGAAGGTNNTDGDDGTAALSSANNGAGGITYDDPAGDDRVYKGHNGRGGEITIQIFSVLPNDSIAYSIGTGGSGGARLNSNWANGGDGANGVVILEY